MTNNIAHNFHLINKIAADIYANTIIAEKRRFVKHFSANICFQPRLAEILRDNRFKFNLDYRINATKGRRAELMGNPEYVKVLEKYRTK